LKSEAINLLNWLSLDIGFCSAILKIDLHVKALHKVLSLGGAFSFVL